jgi:glutathione-regulated potassium-efflux system ancillary protein KefG
MLKILVLFAHPKFEKSRVNKVLTERIKNRENVTFHDLYEQYPDFSIDIPAEKELLVNHDVIIWHHPLYWYSCPPLLKQWIDMVLEYNWAYGPQGNALRGKQALSVVTAGGTREVYCAQGKNNYSVNEFLRPFEQTARLCGMQYLPPFAVMGAHQLTDAELLEYADGYQAAITLLQQGVNLHKIERCDYLNDLPLLKSPTP